MSSRMVASSSIQLRIACPDLTSTRRGSLGLAGSNLRSSIGMYLTSWSTGLVAPIATSARMVSQPSDLGLGFADLCLQLQGSAGRYAAAAATAGPASPS